METGTQAPGTGVQVDSLSFQRTPAGGTGFGLDLARSLRMNRTLALTVGVVVLLVLIPLGLTRKPAYGATTLIYVQPVIAKAPTDASGNYDSARYDSYMEQQLHTFHRPDILSRALDHLPPSVRASFVHDRDSAVKRLDSDLTVTREAGSYEIAVMAFDRDPEVVAPIANAVTLAFLEKGQQDDIALNKEQLDSLSRDRKQIGEELENDRREQADLSAELGMADTSFSDGGNPFDLSLADLRSQIATARNANAVAQAQLASVDAKSAFNPAAESAVREDGELAAMKASLGTRRAALMAEMNGLTSSNPVYIKDEAELDQLGLTINKLTNEVAQKSGQSLKSRLRLEAERTAEIQGRLERELARATTAATSSTPKLQRAQQLAQSIKVLQARYADVDNAVHTLMLAQGPSFAAHITLPATRPTAPLPSKKIAILGLALPIAFLLGIVAAVLKQRFDPRVYTAEDVSRILDISPMAVLPHSDEVALNVKKEFLFRLVAGLEQAHRITGASTFVFTASSQHTAVEMIVRDISTELDALGYRTLELSADEVLNPIGLKSERLGHQRANAVELATPNRDTGLQVRREGVVAEHLERLKQRVDFLFIKAQPLRSSAHTEFVARLGDVTVLVAESGRTTRRELKTCVSIMRRLKARGLAIVVSDLKLRNANKDFLESVRFAESRTYRAPAPKPHEETVSISR